MALVTCPECAAQISSSASKCPSCGFELRKPKRSVFGKFIKYVFIGFNLLMMYWLFAGVGAAADSMSTATSEAEKAGAAVGTGLGAFMILLIWFFGDVIIGALVFFTRAKR
ncbi:zinc ribbon domain-containing protein [Hymenobacter sp. J193]|uniref:zinc ribbon domain-containing protein n=1 Tax=Hymenobacter sp. J193 TaxID=2898429 RepID=UPI0035B4173B